MVYMSLDVFGRWVADGCGSFCSLVVCYFGGALGRVWFKVLGQDEVGANWGGFQFTLVALLLFREMIKIDLVPEMRH